MSDILRAEDIETCKENIQPLREGRRASALKTMVSNTKTAEEIEAERSNFEIRIANFVGPDPLELWKKYLEWSKTTFPSKAQSEFVPLCERCIQLFWHHEPLKLSARFLSIVLSYTELISNPMDIYMQMEQHGIGVGWADYWKARGRAFEAREDWANAELSYQRGVDSLAKPIEMMKSVQTEFEARMYRRMKTKTLSDQNTATADVNAAPTPTQPSSRRDDAENRAPLGALSSTASMRSYEKAPTRGLGTSSGTLATSGPTISQNNKKRGADQLDIFVDDEFATEDDRKLRKLEESGDASAIHRVPLSVPSLNSADSRKENERTAERWIDNKMPQDASAMAVVNRMARASGFRASGPLEGVFEDPTLNDSVQATSTAPLAHPTALKMRDGTRYQRGVAGSSGPYRFTIQSESYPRGSNEPTITSNGAKEKAVYDRTMVYPGDGKEYSFEEIRAQYLAQKALQAESEPISATTIEASSSSMDVDVVITPPQEDIAEFGPLYESSKSLAMEFGKVSVDKPLDTISDSLPLVEAPQSPSLHRAASEPVDEPIIEASKATFVVFEDENSNDGVLPTQTALDTLTVDTTEPLNVVERKPLAPRLSTLVPVIINSSIEIPKPTTTHSTGIVNDENDPLIATPILSGKTESVLSPPSPVTPAPVNTQATTLASPYGKNDMPTLAVMTPEIPKRQSFAPVSASALVVTEQTVKDDEDWRYDPSATMTMSSMTRRTKDAMNEVMGMFQFERTISSFDLPVAAAGDGYDVTASIVIPLDSFAKKLDNNFTIFEDNFETNAFSASPSTPRAALAPRAPAADLLVPFQDENMDVPSPRVANTGVRGLQTLQPQISTSSAPLVPLDVFEDPQTPVRSVPATRMQTSDMIDAMTPPLNKAAADRVSALLLETETTTFIPSMEHTSTLNFTMSGATASGFNLDTMTLNTQNMKGLYDKKEQARKKANGGAHDALFVLPLQADSQGSNGVFDPDWHVTQQQQLAAMTQVGLEGTHDLTSEKAPVSLPIGASAQFGTLSFTVSQALDSINQDSQIFLIESDSGQRLIAQRGHLWDYFVSKRILTKLGSIQPGVLADDAVEELYSSLVDYTAAYVYEDATWLVYAEKPHFTSTLTQLVNVRLSKGLDEILVCYYAQRLLRLVSGLHKLGFVARGALSSASFWAAPALTSDTPNAFRGLCLRDFSSLIDVESFTEGARFTKQSLAQGMMPSLIEALAANSPFASSISWVYEPDLVSIAAMVHLLLHGKEIELEAAAGGVYKPKLAPKKFWNVALWDTLFEVSLSGFANPTNIDLSTICSQVNAHLAAKGTGLRFQMSKLSF